MIAAEIALAFNGINERATWSARPYASDKGERVHFTTKAGLITLVMECDTNRFEVRFNKFHAAWGDYVRSIARSLYVVLGTLKAAGLPFDCPDDVEGMEIISTVGPKGTVYVRWPEQDAAQTPSDAIMPELISIAADRSLKALVEETETLGLYDIDAQEPVAFTPEAEGYKNGN